VGKYGFTKFSSFLIRHAFAIVALGLVVSAFGANFTVHLFKNLRTEIEELLPTKARSILDLGEVKNRLESISKLDILVLSNHPKESKQFVIDFAHRIEKLPKEISSGVEYKIDQELKFFNQRKSLFIEKEDLNRIKAYIRKRIEYEKALANPLTLILNRNIPEPHFDYKKIRKKYNAEASEYAQFPDGFYASNDGKMRVILVNLPGSAAGMTGSKNLRDAVAGILAQMDSKKYAPDIEVEFTGGVEELIEEHEALVEDLLFSTVVVSILVGLAMILYFKSIVGTFSLIAGLTVGILCTFGVGYFLVGYLNANSAFMGSIIIGNGINFGIILLARFMEERRRHRGTLRSIHIALNKTWPATIVAAAAAGLSYGSLMLCSSRGFNQFGVLGFTGMAFCWIASYTVLPAILVCFYRAGFFRRTPHTSSHWFTNSIANLIQKFPKTILLFTSMLTLMSIFSLQKLNSNMIETDLDKLRSRKSIVSGSLHWGGYVDQIFKRYIAPVVILPKSKEEVREIASEVRKIQQQEGKSSLIAKVSSIEDFVPSEQKEKIRLLKQIDGMLSKSIWFQLTPEQRLLASELLAKESLKTFGDSDLPELVKSKFRERNGSIGNMVLVEPILSPELQKSENLSHFINSIRFASDKIKPNTAVAGTLPVIADLFSAIIQDGKKATVFALVAVFLLIILLFRNVLVIAQCSFALILGVLWLFGFILIFDQKINFLNFVAISITCGIGVDYGINIFRRYQLEKNLGILSSVRQTGGAVMLASFTTVTGYGSLLMASNQAFVSFGRLAIVGEFTCVFAAIISLPTLFWFVSNHQKPLIMQPRGLSRVQRRHQPLSVAHRIDGSIEETRNT